MMKLGECDDKIQKAAREFTGAVYIARENCRWKEHYPSDGKSKSILVILSRSGGRILAPGDTRTHGDFVFHNEAGQLVCNLLDDSAEMQSSFVNEGC